MTGCAVGAASSDDDSHRQPPARSGAKRALGQRRQWVQRSERRRRQRGRERRRRRWCERATEGQSQADLLDKTLREYTQATAPLATRDDTREVCGSVGRLWVCGPMARVFGSAMGCLWTLWADLANTMVTSFFPRPDTSREGAPLQVHRHRPPPRSMPLRGPDPREVARRDGDVALRKRNDEFTIIPDLDDLTNGARRDEVVLSTPRHLGADSQGVIT